MLFAMIFYLERVINEHLGGWAMKKWLIFTIFIIGAIITILDYIYFYIKDRPLTAKEFYEYMRDVEDK